MNAFCLADKNHVMLETSYGKFDTLMNYTKSIKNVWQCYRAEVVFDNSSNWLKNS